MEFSHIPVLLQPCLDGLNIDPAGIYLDGTAGGAGHSREIAKRLTTGRLISLDQDPDAVAVATERLKGLPAQVVQVNFREAARVLAELGIPAVNGALLDLGVSSHQLDDAARGFSYHADAPLDMRMSQQGPTAADLVNTLDREELTRILRDYGEEPYAWQIAGKIIAVRETRPITTTMQLADTVAAAVPPAERRKAKNPARRTFQAIRIAVNSELDALNEGLDAIFNCLAPGGRLCVEGRQVSSEDLAAMIAERAMSGAGDMAFVIGSSHGLDDSVKRAAQARISLGRITLPHQLARLVLTEQLYRACTINAGMKYHK